MTVQDQSETTAGGVVLTDEAAAKVKSLLAQEGPYIGHCWGRCVICFPARCCDGWWGCLLVRLEGSMLGARGRRVGREDPGAFCNSIEAVEVVGSGGLVVIESLC